MLPIWLGTQEAPSEGAQEDALILSHNTPGTVASFSINLATAGAVFEWLGTTLRTPSQFARQLRELAACDRSAHAYLDPTANATGIQIIASLDEYDAAQVFN